LYNDYRDKIFNVGIYLRLSKEDEKYGQSESIISQKDFLTSYVADKGWNLKDYYIDDGYSGTNFDRPDFIRMKQDIESGLVNLVVTKDYSRLGRDYIETGYYLEKYFPSMGVRYIAVKDNIDSFSSNCNNDMSPFIGVMNDMYAKDISKKVKTILDYKRENGKFIGAFAPYGYKKHMKDKNKLVIDNSVAYVVKRIYSMYLKGHGYSYIANTLNNEGILSPSRYKELKSNYKSKSNSEKWVNETIKQILSNPTYTGNLAQHKYSKISYKIKKLETVPRKYWIVVENTHEKIIDIDTFNQVQDLMKNKSIQYQRSTNENHLLSGLIYCGDCGSKMTFTDTPRGFCYCICSKYKKCGSKQCSRHSIKEEELNQLIINDLKNKSLLYIHMDKLLKNIEEAKNNNKFDDITNEIWNIEKRLTVIKQIQKSLYIDKLEGVISEADYIDISSDFNKEKQVISKRLYIIKKNIGNKLQLKDDKLLIEVNKIILFEEINRQELIQLIEKIEVFDDSRIKIYYRCTNIL
jgi:DNA invertase Pin-like site-specific DNA recombinase